MPVEHIFKGNLSKKGDAKGFHSIVIGSESKVIKIIKPADKYGVYVANVEVNGVTKKGISTMFPDNWSPQKIIDEVNIAYSKRKPIAGKNSLYFSGETSNGMKIEMQIKNGKIQTAYPQYIGGIK